MPARRWDQPDGGASDRLAATAIPASPTAWRHPPQPLDTHREGYPQGFTQDARRRGSRRRVARRSHLGRLGKGQHSCGARDDPLYAKTWAFDLPATFRQPLDAPGRPAAHADYLRAQEGLVGHIAPTDEWCWHRRHNYYLNCLRDADRNIATLLDALDTLGLAENTIVILTADHGDIDGAHQLHGKGATAYREQNQVPLIVVHPAYAGGRQCRAVTTHLDLAPTLVHLTGADPARKAELTRDLAQDPAESTNLALDRRKHAKLLLAMNDKLNRLIDAEVGENVGQMLPANIDGSWVTTDSVKDV